MKALYLVAFLFAGAFPVAMADSTVVRPAPAVPANPLGNPLGPPKSLPPTGGAIVNREASGGTIDPKATKKDARAKDKAKTKTRASDQPDEM